MKKPPITVDDFKNLMMHVAEQFIYFHIIYNHASLHENEKIRALLSLDKRFTDLLYTQGFTDSEITTLHARDEFWDSMQHNFSYNRVLNTSLLSTTEMEKHKKLTEIILAIKNNNASIQEITSIKDDFQHLFWIRIADIINVVTPEVFLQRIRAAKKHLSSQRGKRRDNYERISIGATTDDNNGTSPICEALSYYPEKLRPGIFYIYPQTEGLPCNAMLALSCHYNADKNDIAEAFDDFDFQFEKFRNYYHMEDNDFSEPEAIERLRPLLNKKHGNAKHIKRYQGIESAIIALICWNKIHFEGVEENKALRMVLPKGYSNNTREEIKNKIATLTKAMNEWDEYFTDMNCI